MTATPEVRVLVVGNDAADLAVVASVVAAHGFELRVIPDGVHVVDEVLRSSPDAIVLDVHQRGASGYELCARLKAREETCGVPVLLTGSLDGPEARDRAYAAGCDDFLEKPINRLTLAHRLRAFARLRRVWASEDHTERILTALCRFAQARGGPGGRDDERLALACARFGAWLGLSGAELRALEYAAPLHDLGATVIEPLPGTTLLVEIVRHHRERWDGRGYPGALAGDAIPRLARIFRALDVFDGLTSRGPHQIPRSTEDALGLLRGDAALGGTDPDVVEQLAAWLADDGHAVWPPLQEQPHQVQP